MWVLVFAGYHKNCAYQRTNFFYNDEGCFHDSYLASLSDYVIFSTEWALLFCLTDTDTYTIPNA